MSHPCLWLGGTYFYPIGNTSAVCLTRDLPPEENATVLLLGCGDPRNILYTIYASGADTGSLSRNLDFTCCDAEGAYLSSCVADNILARNKIDQIWDIFYHFYLDDNTSLLLSSQSRKLANMSQDLATWERSKYGPFLRMCTGRTLSVLRDYWTIYAETSNFTQAQQDKMRETLQECGRSAGPLSDDVTGLVMDHTCRFWMSGTTSNNPQHLTRVNPTFVYSSKCDRFLVHYGTDPLLSFHLAEAYTQTRDTPTIDNIVAGSKAQFRRWCAAFVDVLRTDATRPRVVVRFFAGDALAFCRALLSCSVTRATVTPLYHSPWSVERIHSNDADYGANAICSAPMDFNIIETSNIMDHIGLLNVLISASPLLKRSLSSTLYTESLLSVGTDPYTGMLQRACVDIPTLSLLIGLIPSTFVSGFTTESNIHEIISARIHGRSPQVHERLSWKVAAGGDTVAQRDIGISRSVIFSSQQLAGILFNIYLKMFANDSEDMNKVYELVVYDKEVQNIIHYTPRAFAELVMVAKERLQQQDWKHVMDIFHDLLVNDRTPFTGHDYYQDLFCQFYLLGIYSALPQGAQKTNNPAVFRGWKTVPTTVCIIPRQVITSIAPLLDKIGTPILHCEIRDSTTLDEFSCIHTTYGKLILSGTRENQRAVIAEDLSGRMTNTLIVSFWAPSSTLMLESSASVGFYLRSTPAAKTLLGILGPDLMIYSTEITDEQRVHVLTERPNLDGEVEETAAILEEAQERDTQPTHSVVVAMNSACEKIENLTTRVYITNARTRPSLASASSSIVTMEQVTPFVVQIHIGEYRRVVLFPFAIDVAESKVQVARKSKYIEIVSPLSLGYVKGRPDILVGKFLLVMQGQTATLWNVHRVNLDRLPLLKDEDSGKVRWMNHHLCLMYSDREIKVLQDVMVNLKNSICMMFTSFIGFPNARKRPLAFGLFIPSIANVYTIIFMTGIRLDLSSHTVVANVWVMPLPLPISSMNALGTISVKLLHIETDFEEMRAWKQLLPVLTERCRTWRHKESCEYLAKGIVPLSLECSESPICTCGRGVDTADLQKVEEWKHLAPFVTRAALSPIFSVSYLESSTSSTTPTTEGSTEREPVCAACGNKGKPNLLRCSICKKVYYCSAECQR
ncbi:hypothetical protein SERLA73DRAFT_172514 [Serpula lacrymans var. lacrymans S7.3]|uniref:MYND-type domain-containing protein n=1 Tax=Serpula lacrymans var. lacrymans (strain S7.3) TaxID=936435 RepID=F8QFL3_SERL3|nr:hypothetical protein SERLA73DRAFT_172514 [Serpula lacrymans var. lacrymans S7.3]